MSRSSGEGEGRDCKPPRGGPESQGKGSHDEGHTASLVREGHESAIGFYTSLIPGSSISWTAPIPADTPSGPAGSVKVSAFTRGDQRYMAIEAGPLDPFNHSFSIIVECETQAEIDHLWEALKQGGRTEQCGC